jgi:hypothetical protein
LEAEDPFVEEEHGKLDEDGCQCPQTREDEEDLDYVRHKL